MSKFGEVIADYPRGYGWCQCGCRAMTDRLPNGSYDKYVEDHDSLLTVREVRKMSALMERKAPTTFEGLPAGYSVFADALKNQFDPSTPRTAIVSEPAIARKTKEAGRRQDDRLVNMYADLNTAHVHSQSRLDCLENEVAFAIKYLKAFWKDNPAASRTLIARLESALAAVRVKDRK